MFILKKLYFLGLRLILRTKTEALYKLSETVACRHEAGVNFWLQECMEETLKHGSDISSMCLIKCSFYFNPV